MVTQSDLIEVLNRLPERPFIVRLVDGTEIRVERFGQFSATPTFFGAKDARTGREFSFVPLTQIASVSETTPTARH
ncbi:MAG: hypothetical protein QM770_09390 [Tepidisphaeraceae bacterium]